MLHLPKPPEIHAPTVTCHADDCHHAGPLSCGDFETHCGMDRAKKWKGSIKVMEWPKQLPVPDRPHGVKRTLSKTAGQLGPEKAKRQQTGGMPAEVDPADTDGHQSSQPMQPPTPPQKPKRRPGRPRKPAAAPSELAMQLPIPIMAPHPPPQHVSPVDIYQAATPLPDIVNEDMMARLLEGIAAMAAQPPPLTTREMILAEKKERKRKRARVMKV